jgi:hypothetical protein
LYAVPGHTVTKLSVCCHVFVRRFNVLDGGFDLFLLASVQLVAARPATFHAVHHGFSVILSGTNSTFSLFVFSVHSASFTICWISASDKPELALMVILFSFPVPLSLAPTCRMPLASMSNDFTTCRALLKECLQVRLWLQRRDLLLAWNTLIVTAGWLFFHAVESLCNGAEWSCSS